MGETQFQRKKEQIRKRLLKYTRKAFRMMPQLDKPRILDVGCGSGIPTIELAGLSNGEITGLDINEELLDALRKKIEKAGLSDRVKTVKGSLIDMEFPDESFDIIWAEGSIYAIGFEQGLQEWKRFLKPDGFMVVHDATGNIEEKLEQISKCGYELLGYFELSEKIWWAEYFAPLERLIIDTRTKYPNDTKVLGELQNSQMEIDMFQKNPEMNSSVVFVMKKNQ